jgi:hypothetical protein
VYELKAHFGKDSPSSNVVRHHRSLTPEHSLRFSFVNVGPRSGAPRDPDAPKVNTGRAPILASCFSESFMVYSAKKFPGVCESTPLSKIFAGQGIKIPIRKDGAGKGGDNDDDMD